MIRSIEVKGMRALRYTSVSLDPFMVMVGPNASGKSTLFDSLLFVRDVLSDGLHAAVFGHARTNILPRVVDPRDLTWMRQGGNIEFVITLNIPEVIAEEKFQARYRTARYELMINTDGGLSYGHEALWLCPESEPLNANALGGPSQLEFEFPRSLLAPSNVVTHTGRKAATDPRRAWRKVVNKVVDSGNDYFQAETSAWNNLFRLGPAKSALANLPEDEQKFPVATWVKRVLLERVHRLALNAEKMRMPSPAGSASDFLPDGSNLPWVVETLSPARKQQWVSHIATALEDLAGIDVVERPEDRSKYIVVRYRSGLQAPSWVLSDGTLRLLALTLLAYATRADGFLPGIILIEEPENGVHPKAIETVMQSLQSVYDAQVLCATHSPVVLSGLERRQILCFGKTEDGAVDVVRGDLHPALKQWQSALHLGDLFASGVLG